MYLNVSVVFFLILGISNRFMVDDVPSEILTFSNGDLDSLKVNRQNLDSLVTNARDIVVESIPQDSTNTEIVTDIDEVFGLIGQNIPKDTVKKSTPYVYHIDRDSTGTVGVFNRIQDFDRFYRNNKELKVEDALDSIGYDKTFWNKFYYQQVQIGHKNIKDIREDGGKSFIKKMMSQISIALFVFLPVFTLFLKLIYIRRKFKYMEHLVFVFHTQTVFFLLLTIFYVLNFVVTLTNFVWVFLILFLIYLYKALRNFYNQGRIKTLIKFYLLNSYYMFLASIGLIFVAMLSILTA
jgi:hypothetical protein